MIVFLHMPKCGGTSLLPSLYARLGRANIKEDYGGFRGWRWQLWHGLIYGQVPPALVYGHFNMDRYCLRDGSKDPAHFYATYFREPLQRAISHYYYQERHFHLRDPMWWEQRLKRWSLEQFLLDPRNANLQCRYMGPLKVEDLDFSGLTERYDDGLALLGRLKPELAGLSAGRKNFNPKRALQGEYSVDPDLAARFRALNAADYSLYAAAQSRFMALFDQNRY